MVVEDLRTGTARAVVAHRPEIVLGRDADDPAFGQAGDLLPQVERLVVGVIDGDGQPVGIEAPFLGQQGPGVMDRLFLEIVAEGEIPQHFEEGVVARGVADIVEVVVLAAGADALLAADRGRIGPRFQPGEDILERHHAGVDEHQRRVVVRHQRRRWHARMPVPSRNSRGSCGGCRWSRSWDGRYGSCCIAARRGVSATGADPSRLARQDSMPKRGVKPSSARQGWRHKPGRSIAADASPLAANRSIRPGQRRSMTTRRRRSNCSQSSGSNGVAALMT